MQYQLRQPALAMRYQGEDLSTLPEWVIENAATTPGKDPVGSLIVTNHGMPTEFGPSHAVVPPGHYLVFAQNGFETMEPRTFERIYAPVESSEEPAETPEA